MYMLATEFVYRLKLPPNPIFSHLFFKIFLGGMPPDPLEGAWLCTPLTES